MSDESRSAADLFAIVAGTPGLRLEDVVHVLVPGRGRDESGAGLNVEALDRVRVARALFEAVAAPAGGRIVCSGYKSPADRKGKPWSPDGEPGQVSIGVPEAELMRQELIRLGVPEGAVRAEPRSIDTVTNLLRSEREGYFGDGRPVAIVAQPDHLPRILGIIAPRALRRPYLGVAVPQEHPHPESFWIHLASRIVLTRLPKGEEDAIRVATARAERIWRVADWAGKKQYH